MSIKASGKLIKWTLNKKLGYFTGKKYTFQEVSL